MVQNQDSMNLSSINDQSEYVNLLDNLIGTNSLDRKDLFIFKLKECEVFYLTMPYRIYRPPLARVLLRLQNNRIVRTSQIEYETPVRVRLPKQERVTFRLI